MIKIPKRKERRSVTDKAVHKAAWGTSKCLTCKGPPVIEIRVSMLLKELMTKEKNLFEAIGFLTGGQIPTFETTYGTMVCVSNVFACTRCRKDAEKAAAKAPSCALVEIFQKIPKSWTSKTIQVPVAVQAESNGAAR